MQVVSAIWYRIYYGWMLAFSVVLAIASLLVIFLPHLRIYQAHYGLTFVTLALALLEIMGSIIAHQVVRWNDWPITTRIALSLFGLMLLCGLAQSSAGGTYVYMAAWVVMVMFSSILGVTAIATTLFLTVAYALVINDFQVSHIEYRSVALVIASVVFGFVGYQICRKLFVRVTPAHISRLAGPLRSSSQQSQEIIIGAIADGVLVFDKNGKINLINPAAAVLTEWTSEDALGLDAHLVIKLAQENGQVLQASEDPLAYALSHKISTTHTLQLIGRHNKQTIVSVVISPIILPPNNDIEGAVAVIHDITQQRKEEAQRAEFISIYCANLVV